jgi:hypothetical protein
MDLNDIKNTVSNLTLYDLKAGFRKAQNGARASSPKRKFDTLAD